MVAKIKKSDKDKVMGSIKRAKNKPVYVIARETKLSEIVILGVLKNLGIAHKHPTRNKR